MKCQQRKPTIFCELINFNHFEGLRKSHVENPCRKSHVGKKWVFFIHNRGEGGSTHYSIKRMFFFIETFPYPIGLECGGSDSNCLHF